MELSVSSSLCSSDARAEKALPRLREHLQSAIGCVGLGVGAP